MREKNQLRLTIAIFSIFCFPNYLAAQFSDTLRICQGEVVTLEGYTNLICCSNGIGPCGPGTQPGGRWEGPSGLLCVGCIFLDVSPATTTVYQHFTPEYRCPTSPPPGGGPAPPAGPSYPAWLKETVVIVDAACPTPQIRDTVRVCRGESVVLEDFNLIQCPCTPSDLGPTDCFADYQPGGVWSDATGDLCQNCVTLTVRPERTKLYRHFIPAYNCPPPPPGGGGPAPPPSTSFPSRLNETLVIVEDCPPPCSTNRGTFFFEDCDDGTPYFFVRLTDGRVFDPYFAVNIDFQVTDNQRVKFDYEIADFATPCSIAEAAITITCVEEEFIPGTPTDNCICDVCGVENPLELTWVNSLLNFPLARGMNVFWNPTTEQMVLTEIPIAPDVGVTYYNCSGGIICQVSGFGVPEVNTCPASFQNLEYLGSFRKPDGTMLCGDDGNTYNSYCAAECAGVSITGEGECIPVSLFDDYPWLNSLVDEQNCSGTTIYEYNLGNYSFIYIDTENTAKLYFQNGQFYCESVPGYDCLALYNLASLSPNREYVCDDNQAGMPPNFDTYPWLENVLNQNDCCENEQVIDYESGIYHFIYIYSPNCAGTYGQLYFEDGTFYCQEGPNYDCRAAYNLSDGEILWNCTDGSLVESKIRNKPLKINQLETTTLVAYPNPIVDLLTVQLNNSSETGTVRLYNLNGSLLQQQDLIIEKSATLQLDLSAYESGVYLLEWRTESEIITTKVIRR